MRMDGAEEAVRVLLIDACPVLNADGTPVLRGDGSPLYQLRNLHLSAALIARLKGEGYACVLFRLGDAVLLIRLDELEDADYIFTLEPILPGEATAAEEEAFRGFMPLSDPHRLCVRIGGEIVKLTGTVLRFGAIWEQNQVPPEDMALRVFCEEGELAALEDGQTAFLAEEADDQSEPLWTLLLSSTPQTEARRLTFAPVSSVSDGE